MKCIAYCIVLLLCFAHCTNANGILNLDHLLAKTNGLEILKSLREPLTSPVSGLLPVLDKSLVVCAGLTETIKLFAKPFLQIGLPDGDTLQYNIRMLSNALESVFGKLVHSVRTNVGFVLIGVTGAIDVFIDDVHFYLNAILELIRRDAASAVPTWDEMEYSITLLRLSNSLTILQEKTEALVQSIADIADNRNGQQALITMELMLQAVVNAMEPFMTAVTALSVALFGVQQSAMLREFSEDESATVNEVMHSIRVRSKPFWLNGVEVAGGDPLIDHIVLSAVRISGEVSIDLSSGIHAAGYAMKLTKRWDRIENVYCLADNRDVICSTEYVCFRGSMNKVDGRLLLMVPYLRIF